MFIPSTALAHCYTRSLINVLTEKLIFKPMRTSINLKPFKPNIDRNVRNANTGFERRANEPKVFWLDQITFFCIAYEALLSYSY